MEDGIHSGSKFAVSLSFVGTDFHGWQLQPNQISVQEEIEIAFSKLLGEQITLYGCGRTDTGVHAKYYVAHFISNKNDLDCLKAAFQMNSILPASISIFQIWPVSHSFHARFSARKRTYQYQIIHEKNPFLLNFAWLRYTPLNIDKMNEAGNLLLNHTSFECFCKGTAKGENYECKIFVARWIVLTDKLVFEISANRFLRSMVRSIVACMIKIGHNEMSLTEFSEMIVQKNRKAIPALAPAKGLFLTGVEYE